MKATNRTRFKCLAHALRLAQAAVGIALTLCVPVAQAADNTYIWTGGDSQWSTSTNWNPNIVGGASGAGNIVKLTTSSAIDLNASITIGVICIAQGSANLAPTITSSGGSILTMDGTGVTINRATNTAGAQVDGEAYLGAYQNNSNVGLKINADVNMASDLGIGGSVNSNYVTVGTTANSYKIRNSTVSTKTLNLRPQSTGPITINSSIGVDQTQGTGGIAIVVPPDASASGAITIAGDIGGPTSGGTLGQAITITNTNASTGTFTISGAIGQSVSSVTQNSATSVTALSGNNANFAGTITVTTGALSFLNTTAKAGTTTVANGATLGLGVTGTNAFTFGDVDNLFGSGLSGITMGATSNVGIDTTNGSFTYATSVGSTTKGLNKLGANTVILTGTNAYTGPTIITGGILQIGNAGTTGTLSTSSAITNNAQITFKRSDNILQGTHFSSAGISGTGSLVKDGAGSLTLNVANTYGGTTTVSAGTLKIASGGSFTTTVTNNTSLVVGNVSGNSLLHIQNGGAGTTSRLQVGTVNGGVGAIYNQGTLTVNGSANLGNFALGYATGAYGYYRHDTSTTTTANEIGIATSSATTTANLGGNGVMDVLQGKVANAAWFAMNRGDATQYSQLNISGGTFELANSATQVGLFMNNNDTQNNKGGHAVINVSGAGSLTSAGTATELDLMRISQPTAATGMLGVLNIGTGGTVQTSVIKATQANGTALVNFNGGTLKANNTGVTLMGGSNIDGAYIYSGGAIIDTNGKDVTISQALLAPTGSGVSSIPVTASGTGYIGRPVVYLTGGGGTGATAVADFNPTTGEVTGITITNPGTGYTSAPTVTFTGGGGTAPTLGTISTATNTSGDLTKSGSGNLTLTGVNTYTGNTIVSSGNLVISGSGALTQTGNVVVTSGGSLLIGASNVINNSAKAVMDGGKIAMNGAFSETFGALTLTSGSTLDFGSSGVQFVFANSNANWTDLVLTIKGWNTGTTSLQFGTDATGLSSNQLANISFDGIGTGATIDSSGFVTPVPEPGTILAGLLLLGGLAFAERRRLRKILKTRNSAC